MYSIWLLPSKTASKRFQIIINQLSAAFKTPIFEPHLTLFTNIPQLTDEVFYKTSVLAALTTTFEVELSELKTSKSYYKSLFADVKDNSKLQDLHQEIQNLFPNIQYDFQPHLSLLYSEMEEEVLTANLKKENWEKQLLMCFEVGQLCIVKTNEVVEDWKVIEIFELYQNQNLTLDFIYDTVKNLRI